MIQIVIKAFASVLTRNVIILKAKLIRREVKHTQTRTQIIYDMEVFRFLLIKLSSIISFFVQNVHISVSIAVNVLFFFQLLLSTLYSTQSVTIFYK